MNGANLFNERIEFLKKSQKIILNGSREYSDFFKETTRVLSVLKYSSLIHHLRNFIANWNSFTLNKIITNSILKMKFLSSINSKIN